MAKSQMGPERPDARRGRIVGDWRIARHVATGAMGWIYAVESVGGAPPAILKLLRPGLNSAALRARFVREWRIMQRLDGEAGVPRVLDTGEMSDGLPFFVMEFVPGDAADAYCTAHAPTLGKRLALVIAFGRILARIHARGVIHGDLKPENALASAGATWLIDYGTARVFAPATDAAEFALLSDVGSQICTPQFASTEQLCGQPPTVRSDVYGLGALLYAVVCGRPPQERSGRSLAQFAAYVAQTPARRLSEIAAGAWLRAEDAAVLRLLDDVVMRALAANANERYASVDELIAKLEPLAE